MGASQYGLGKPCFEDIVSIRTIRMDKQPEIS